MKNGLILRQSAFRNDKGECIAFVQPVIYIDGERITVSPIKTDKRIFNMICKNKGFVIGQINSVDEVDKVVSEVIGE